MNYLEQEDVENFYIISVFELEKGYHFAGIKRAYLDFCRTLKKEHDETERQRIEKREEVGKWLIERLKKLIGEKCESQIEFDEKHERLCKDLKNKWGRNFTIGHSQKWINMTLKYWLLFGEERISDIGKNYEFFHIPIDSIVQERMFADWNKHSPWSKFETYEDYFKYQEEYRNNTKKKEPAIIDELKTFNEYFLKNLK